MRIPSPGAVTFQLGILCAAVAIASSQGSQGGQDRWAQADASIVRHPPGRFTELPLRIRLDLESRGCRVPQSDVDGPVGSHNVISGQFTTLGGRQWAVLCSIRDTSRILVYPNDSTTAADSLAPGADRVSLQQVEMGRIAYSRRISAADDSDFFITTSSVLFPPPDPSLLTIVRGDLAHNRIFRRTR
jgi:hypothetical protein